MKLQGGYKLAVLYTNYSTLKNLGYLHTDAVRMSVNRAIDSLTIAKRNKWTGSSLREAQNKLTKKLERIASKRVENLPEKKD